MAMAPITLKILLVSLLTIGASQAVASAPKTASLILTNGKVYTVNPQQPWAEAVAVAGEHIIYVGDTETALKLAGEDTQKIDLQGQMLLPGFQDSHLHLLWGGEAAAGCNLAMADTPEAVRNTLLDCKAKAGRGEDDWVVGKTWERTSFPGGEPSAGFLDEIFPNRPVTIEASDGHSQWANRRALEIAGINRATLNPPNGVVFRNPENGEPNGFLSGSAINLLMDHVPAPTHTENMQFIQAAVRLAHSFGITSAIEPGLSKDRAAAFNDLAAQGQLRMRLQLCLAPSGWEIDQFGPEVFAFLDQVPAPVSGLLTHDCVKMFMDGALEAETAAMLEPYLGEADTFPPFYTIEELTPILQGLEQRGVSAHIHAIGDAATHLALNGLEASRPDGGFRTRPLITHLQFASPDDTQRFGALGVAASFSPYWAYPDDYTLEIYPALVGMEKNLSAYPIKSIQDGGARILGSSDWSVSDLNPLLAIETAITRQDPHTNRGDILGEAQRLELQTMIEAYTINVAWAMGREGETGTLEVGKKADLVVLEHNLFEISPYEISDVRVMRTFFDGDSVFTRDGTPEALPTTGTDSAPPQSSPAARTLWIQNRFTGKAELVSIPAPDTALWNKARIGHYENSLTVESSPPMGLLKIAKLGLDMPVYNGAEEHQLNLGAGRITGTGLFEGDGNLAISSHRDGYFRGLKDIAIGDEITLQGVNGLQEFVVTEFKVVHKSDLSPLRPSDERMLTLVTCHPFYFQGNAPDRFIVQAAPKTPADAGSP